jgi:hypothetical protein
MLSTKAIEDKIITELKDLPEDGLIDMDVILSL